jgi:tetratricopeptide (TPR) repeat protein
MKRLILLLSVFCFSASYSQNAVFEEVNKLIKDRKYESAMKVLDQADPGNLNPRLVIAKTDLFLNYFVTNRMHQVFGLKDLETGEDLTTLRNSKRNFTMFPFAPDSLLNGLITDYPHNYELIKTLGKYYYEVHLKFPRGWLDPDSVLIQRFIENFEIAYKHKVFDYLSLYCLGYGYLLKTDYMKSITFFKKSIKLKDDYAPGYYNLAYALLSSNHRKDAIINAQKAFNLYNYAPYKADAAKMIALNYLELAQDDLALEYYLLADSIYPGNYVTLKHLIGLEMKMGMDDYKIRTRQFFLLEPASPRIYQDLMQMYWENNKEDELIRFLEEQKPTYKKDKRVLANVYLYIANIQYDKKDFRHAKVNFEESRDLFKEVYRPDHKVFEVIDTYLDKIGSDQQ